MTIFNLPDLGEGLADAEIHEWLVNLGDEVVLDQPMVAMETAKSVVEIPCPQSGIVTKLYGKPGDTINTGEPLIAFQTSVNLENNPSTVVGKLEENHQITEDHFTIGSSSTRQRPKATPKVRVLARQLGVDLNTIIGTGENQLITQQDVENALEKESKIPDGFEPLRGVRRAMSITMTQSHQEVVPVSLFDVANIQCWSIEEDITIRLIRAIEFACHQEPALNAWFNGKHNARRCFDVLHLGLAMDSRDGLFVPVIHHVAKLSNADLREKINQYKTALLDRSMPPEQLKDASFTLTNFGKFSGRFASPIVVPPTVAILGAGRCYPEIVHHQDMYETHRQLPLSLTFDHRAVTGGEATRFLAAVIESLQEKTWSSCDL